MKSFRLGLATLVLLVLMPASPAFSASGSTASCLVMSPLSFSPGIRTASQRVTSTSHGETGTITCVGTVNGHEVMGPGTIGFAGFFDVSCLGGTGHETVSVTIPTSAGPEKLNFPVDETVFPGIGYKSSESLLGPLAFVYYPTEGNCVTSPVTEVAFAGQGVLKS